MPYVNTRRLKNYRTGSGGGGRVDRVITTEKTVERVTPVPPLQDHTTTESEEYDEDEEPVYDVEEVVVEPDKERFARRYALPICVCIICFIVFLVALLGLIIGFVFLRPRITMAGDLFATRRRQFGGIPPAMFDPTQGYLMPDVY